MSSLDRSLSGSSNRYLPTCSGTWLRLRPVQASDGLLLGRFFARLASEPIRRRFLDALSRKGRAGTAGDIDRHAEHLLAFDTCTGELTGTLVTILEPRADTMEAAIAVANDWQGRGVGSALLNHASELALSLGARKLRCFEDRASGDAVEVRRTLGFHPVDIEGEPDLVMLEAELD